MLNRQIDLIIELFSSPMCITLCCCYTVWSLWKICLKKQDKLKNGIKGEGRSNSIRKEGEMLRRKTEMKLVKKETLC